MSVQPVFTPSLAENFATMRRIFDKDNTFVTRFTVGAQGLRCFICFIDGMVNNQIINDYVVHPLQHAPLSTASTQLLCDTIVQVNDSKPVPDSAAMLSALLYGDTVIFTQGDPVPLVVNTKGFAVRSTSEPDNERVLRGPREGFTEGFMSNLALLRRRLNNPHLKLEFRRLTPQTQTVVCLCWLAEVADTALVDAVRQRIDQLPLHAILDSNYIAECIRDCPRSPFPTLGTTERPDVVAAHLLEGRIAILVDGTPVALTAPCVLQECFQSSDDYYIAPNQANLSRVLRVLGFLVSICTPALYAALLFHHAQVLPLRLYLAITAAQRGVPLSPVLELFVLLITFQILKEAGTRTPNFIGSTMSIVGGLVLGQAAVSARFLSAPAVIVVALAGVTGLTAPKLQSAGLLMQFVLLLAGAIGGLAGVMLGLLAIGAHLCQLTSFGTPYLLNMVSRVHPHREDLWLRTPWRWMHNRRFLAQKGGDA